MIVIALLLGLLLIVIPILLLRRYKYNYDSSIINFIPSLCTSLGILFSFSTIWWVLSQGSSVQNAIQNQKLGEIIGELAGKFLFSIIGILFSIIWSAVIKYRLTQKEEQEKYEKYAQENPHEILWTMRNILEEKLQFIYEEAKKQTAAQGQFSTVILHLKGIENTIDNNVKQTLQSIDKQAKEQLTAIALHLKGIERIIDNHVKETLLSIDEQAKKQTAAQEQLKKNQTEIKVKLTDIYDDFYSELKEQTAIQKQLKTESSDANEAFRLQNSMLRSIEELMSGAELKKVLDELKQTLEKNINAMGEEATKEAALLHSKFEEFLKTRVAALETQSAKEMGVVQSEIHTTLTALKDTTETSAGGLATAIANINKTLESLQSGLTSQVTTVQTNLGVQFQNTINTILDNKVNQIKQIFDNLETLRQQSQTTLTTTISEFSKSVISFREAQSANKDVLEELGKQINITSELQENMDNLYKAFTSQESEIKNMNDHIQTIANMAKELQKLSGVLSLLPIKKD